MTSSSLPGAGAWRRPKWYGRSTMGRVINATDPDDERRQRLGAGAIQAELDAQGYLEAGAHDGFYGPKTDAAIRAFQQHHGLSADGLAGPATLRRLCWPVILWEQEAGRIRIPGNLLLGMLRLESALDPGAQGRIRTHGTDMGLAQINDEANPGVSAEQAYGDIRFAVRYAGNRLREARRRQSDEQSYADLGRWDCAIADHNNPSKADQWFDTGQPPDDQIADYVDLVRSAARLPL